MNQYILVKKRTVMGNRNIEKNDCSAAISYGEKKRLDMNFTEGLKRFRLLLEGKMQYAGCLTKILCICDLLDTVWKRNHVFTDEQTSLLLTFKMNNPSWRHWLKERRGFISTAFIYLWCWLICFSNTQCRNPKSTCMCNTCPKDHQGFTYYTL